MIILLPTLLALGCRPGKTEPALDGGSTIPIGPIRPTEPTEPWGPPRQFSYTCPDPPADALRIRLGTLLAHHVFYSGIDPQGRKEWDPDSDPTPATLFPLYALKLRGLSYTDADSCALLDIDNLYYLDIRQGTVTDPFELDLQLSIPGDRVEDFLGEHGDGGATADVTSTRRDGFPDKTTEQALAGDHQGRRGHRPLVHQRPPTRGASRA